MRWVLALAVLVVAVLAIRHFFSKAAPPAISDYVPNKPVPLENKVAPLTAAEKVVAPLSAETTTSKSSGLPSGSGKSLLVRVGSDV